MKLDTLLVQADMVSLHAAGDIASAIEVSAITFDSRRVRPGALFVALRGASVDGHRFVHAADDAGAGAILVDRARANEFENKLNCPLLVASDTRQALGPLSAAFFGHPADHLCVVGVTGTNGKTTITWILDALFSADTSNNDAERSQKEPVSGLLGTIEYRWGDHREAAKNTTPESLVIQRVLAEMRRDGVQRVAMEVSSHGLATHRLGGAHFDAAIFSNFTQDHLDFHGDMDAYRDAKGRLFSELLPASKRAGKDPVAIINIDDPAGEWFAQQARDARVETITFGQSVDADWRATRIVQTLEGTRFLLCAPDGSFPIESHLMGDFNVSNMLAAIVGARRAGVAQSQIQATLAALESVPGRMQRVEATAAESRDAQPAVFVDYAHTPDALMRALETLRPLTDGRVIVVFGCGGDRDRQKRAPMGKVAVEGADIALVTTDNPRSESPEAIIGEILTGADAALASRNRPAHRIDIGAISEAKSGVWVESRRARAIAEAIAAAGPQDVVLIAGKGHENYQEQNGERVPFDDVELARAALDAKMSAKIDRNDSTQRIGSWSLAKIANAIGGRLHFDAVEDTDAIDLIGSLRPTGVSSDTRTIASGELFVALRGDNFDAHDFLARADKGGAVAIMVDRVDDLDTQLPLIVVDDTLAGLSRLGHAIWREARDAGLRTINVTGSNGKTTVKEMLALLWGARAEVFATPGNLNNHIGVPLVLCAIPHNCERLIVEMGANGPNEISQLLALAPGSQRIITSIGLAHIEGFGSLDGIRQAKAEIFENPTEQTTAIMPFSEASNLVSPNFPGRVLTVGFEQDADLRVELIQPGGEYSQDPAASALEFRLHYTERQFTLRLPIPGAHHALNAATAIATLIAADKEVDARMINAELAKLALPAGRWRIVEKGDFSFIDDAYNANPSSTIASVQAFVSGPNASSGQISPTRVVMLGEMRELGDASEKLHRDVAAEVAGFAQLDALICVGAYAQQMADAVRKNPAKKHQLAVVAFDTVDSAAPWVQNFAAQHGGVHILLKASRGARLERVIDLVDPTGEKYAGDEDVL